MIQSRNGSVKDFLSQGSIQPRTCSVKDCFSQGFFRQGIIQPRNSSVNDQFSQGEVQPRKNSVKELFNLWKDISVSHIMMLTYSSCDLPGRLFDSGSSTENKCALQLGYEPNCLVGGS